MNKLMFYRITRPLIKLFVLLMYNPKIEGKEYIDEKEGIILAGNHTNNLDCILLISSTKRTIRFLAKDDLNKGIKKYLFRSMGILPVDRKTHKNEETIKNAEEVLNNNGVIGIFPEGTTNETDEVILPFKKGAVNFAKNTGKKIVPFVIKGKFRPFGKLRLRFLKPIEIKNESIDEFNNKLMNIIKNSLEETWD